MAMDINLKKEAERRLIDLSKKAKIVIDKSGLQGQRAKVALALDISYSMKNLYKKGVVQRACERLLALAVNFDDNESIDIFLFGTNDYEVGELHKSNFYGFVDREIYQKYKLEGTNYAGVMQRILNKYVPHATQQPSSQSKSIFGDLFSSKEPIHKKTGAPLEEPVYVIFVTDGNNFDHGRSERMMQLASHYGIFWKFVGIGSSSFPFLERLDDLRGRLIDNAHFFHLNDLEEVGDEELYRRLLIEFPEWIKVAKDKGLIMQDQPTSPPPVQGNQPTSSSVRMISSRRNLAGLTLRKGQKADLTKEHPSLQTIRIGFGWNTTGVAQGQEIDVDGSAFLLGPTGKAGGDQDIVFYGNAQSENGAIIHRGEPESGSDREEMMVDLGKVPARVSKIAFTLTIYDAEVRGHHFDQLSDLYIRVVDDRTGTELMRFPFGQDFTMETAIVSAELYRHGDDWKMNAVGSGFYGGLKALCESYGIEVEG